MSKEKKPCICQPIFKCFYCLSNTARVDCHTYFVYCSDCKSEYLFMTSDEYMDRIKDERIRWDQVGKAFKHSAFHSWSGGHKEDITEMERQKNQICKVCKSISSHRKMAIEDGENSICIWCYREQEEKKK